MVTTRPAPSALAVAGIRFITRACGRAEGNGTAGGMQGSSNAVSPILYSTAVTVRFFDAAVLALFASRARSGGRLWSIAPTYAGFSGKGDSPNRPSLGGQLGFAHEAAIQIFVALRRSRPGKFSLHGPAHQIGPKSAIGKEE